MHIPEQLFSLPMLKDVRTQSIELIVRRAFSASGGLAGWLSPILFTVPKDRIWICTSFSVEFSADAAGGTAAGVGLFLQQAGGANQSVCAATGGGYVLSAGQPAQDYGNSCSIWFPPGSECTIRMTSNGAGNHSAFFNVSGLSIPRGSIAVG